MAVSITSYHAPRDKGILKSVDFSTVDGKALTFFELQRPSDLSTFQQMVTKSPLSQEILALTYVSGRPVVVTRGMTSSFFLLDSLKEQGEVLEPMPQKKGFDAWKVRSLLGFTGQALQMTSSFLRPSRKVDISVFVFAAANLAANTINLCYNKGEQVEDVHQLHYLKQRVNRELAPHMAQGEHAFSVNEHRAELHEHVDKKPMDKAKGFLERHSVAVGELGLRYLGAIGLAFPASGWKAAFKSMKMPAMDPSRFRVYTGMSSILGKTVALGSEIPDPYNPKKPTILDWMREKYTFLVGGLIEITSFSVLAYDSFFHSSGKQASRGILWRGKNYRDWLGGIGATMFVMGYIARLWAPFGERHVNTKELYAHVSDTLAKTPPEKTPQLLANTAAGLSEHFDGNGPRFSEIYSSLVDNLARFHAQVGKQVLTHKTVSPLNALQPVVSPSMAIVDKPTNRIQGGQVELAEPLGTAPAVNVAI